MDAPKILVVNCGSSSLKFAYLQNGVFLAEGLYERLGTPEASARWKAGTESGTAQFPCAGHEQALTEAVRMLEAQFGKPLAVDAVGHRVVHGGEFFNEAKRIDADVLEKIELCRDLAPLHNPAHALGIRIALKLFPNVPHVAVFDTAFHQTMPKHAWGYALPEEMHEKYAVRRYGAHGTSHAYVAKMAAEALVKPLQELQIVTAHLGNGCSACAVRYGQSVDTTMGLTPLEGLMMGTRSGDVDPNIQPYLQRVAGMTPDAVTELLNRKSGLLGVSGISNDMRAVIEAASNGNPRAELAVKMYCYRLAKGILGMLAGLDRLDALVFTGGIGENSALIRERTLDCLQVLHPRLDPQANTANGKQTRGRITSEDSGLTCLVIPTCEERAIAEHAAAFL